MSGDNLLQSGTWLFLTFSWSTGLPGSGHALCWYHQGRALQRGFGLLQGMGFVNKLHLFSCAPKAFLSVRGKFFVKDICLCHSIAEETELQRNKLLHLVSVARLGHNQIS